MTGTQEGQEHPRSGLRDEPLVGCRWSEALSARRSQLERLARQSTCPPSLVRRRELVGESCPA